ncbi:hypothetical protein [uncultured Xylophilus sp.]|uniref:hypothetical protein n=1 Tax=uncultured Xylophilus sp. TaxID=296832 RepID=UPI0025EA9DEC|nr:hypothetical protein [uncultured Xylophilus sp.]
MNTNANNPQDQRNGAKTSTVHLASDLPSRWLLPVGAIAVSIALAGCEKPPACGDTSTAADVHTTLLQQVQKRVVRAGYGSDDPDGVLPGYLRTVKSELVQVVYEGYNAEAKKNICKATMRVTHDDFKPQERPILYTSRLTEDITPSGKRDTLVEIIGMEPLIETVSVFAQQHYLRHRYSGNWNGTYSCTGVDGAESGPQGPYKQDVTLVGDGINAKLERTTKGGGVEVLNGTLSQQAFLEGKGQNNADDFWVTKFAGEIQGKQLTATGTLALPFDPRTMTTAEVLRRCELQLTQEARK